jgi:hypothetical protein
MSLLQWVQSPLGSNTNTINLWGVTFIFIILNYILYHVIQTWRRYVVSGLLWRQIQVINSVSTTNHSVISTAVYRWRPGFLTNGL